MNGSLTVGSTSSRESIGSPQSPQVHIVEGNISSSEPPRTSNTPLDNVEIQSHEAIPVLTIDDIADILGDQSQDTLNILDTLDTLISPAIPSTASAQTLSQINTDAVLNSTECADKTPNCQSEESNKLPVLQQLPIAGSVMDPSPVASSFPTHFTFLNIVLECLKNGDEMTSFEIQIAIKKRYPYIYRKSNNWKGRITTLLIQKRNLEIFEYRIEANGSSYIKYWRINKRVAADIKNLVVINSETFKYKYKYGTPPCPIQPSISNPLKVSPIHVKFTFKNILIECLQYKKAMTFSSIYEEIRNRYPFLRRKNKRWSTSLSSVLTKSSLFTKTTITSSTLTPLVYWSINAIKEKTMRIIVVIHPKNFNSVNSTSSITTSSEEINLIDLITEHLKNGRRMPYKSLCNEIEKQKPYIADTYPHWKHDVRSTLKESGRFEIKNDRAWSIKESRMKDITPRLTVGTEKFPIPPSTIIQTHLPPPLISRGYVPIASAMEPQADQQSTSKMTSLSVLQSEKNLAHQGDV